MSKSCWTRSQTVLLLFSFLLIQLHMLLTCCPVGKHDCYLWEMLSSSAQFWIHWRPSNEFHMFQMNCIPRKWFNFSGNRAIKPDFPAWPDGFTVTSHYFSLSSQNWRTGLTISVWSDHMCFSKKQTHTLQRFKQTSPKFRLLSMFLIVCILSSTKKEKQTKKERKKGKNETTAEIYSAFSSKLEDGIFKLWKSYLKRYVKFLCASLLYCNCHWKCTVCANVTVKWM